MPTCNGEEFLPEALNSCLIQDYPNLELIISDDESTDRTLEIINHTIPNLTFPVKLIHHKRNGIGANWNNCVKNASGEYIKFLFQDDLMEPDCISKMMDRFNNNSNLAIVACKRNILTNSTPSTLIQDWINQFGDLQKQLKPQSNGHYTLSKRDISYNFFYKGPRNQIGEPSVVLLKKSILEQVGLFREDMKQELDCECWWRMLVIGDILILNEKLASFRLHDKQTTNQNRNVDVKDTKIIERIILTKYLWIIPKKEKIRVLYHRYLVIRWLYDIFK